MRFALVAALALSAAAPLYSQVAPSLVIAKDLGTAMPADGAWTYATVPGGSEITFQNAAAQTQLAIRCSRPTRQVTISRPATGAAPFLYVWTSDAAKNLPASFNPATGRATATVSAFDPLLDSLAFSRGRAGFTVTGQAPLVVPAWSQAARVVEDCRT